MSDIPRNSASPDTIRIGGTLPGGTQFGAVIAADLIVLNVDGRICAAHPPWMTPAQATRLAESLLALAGQ